MAAKGIDLRELRAEARRLPIGAQVIAVLASCSDLNNGTVEFTCEDEIDLLTYVLDPKVAELSYQVVEVANILLNEPDPPAAMQDYLSDDDVTTGTVDMLVQTLTKPEEDNGAPTMDEVTYLDLWPVAVKINLLTTNDASQSDPFWQRFNPYYRCGSWWRPFPRTADRWNTFTEYTSIPQATARLTEIGYHRTPGGIWGGGWTRPQTYSSSICGLSTYRDHAYIMNNGNIREQNYTVDPGGEPNPEIWRSGPWPYAVWPLYVRWWHAHH